MNKILFLRTTILSTFIFIFNYFLEADLNLFLIIIATFIGVKTGDYLSDKANVILKTISCLVIASLVSPGVSFLGSFSKDYNLLSVSISYTLTSLIIIFSLLLISTLLIKKSSSGATLETIILFALPISILASHRNFRFDLAKIINDLAWQFQLSHVYLLVVLGVIFCVLAGINLTISNHLNASSKKLNLFALIINSILLCFFISIAGHEISKFYYNKSQSVLKNGVGEANENGLSPIDFNQSLGVSTEPAALVRLQGDYKNNPFTQILYFRESALSDLGENKLIISKEFDQDVSFSSPIQDYNSIWRYGDDNRTSLGQEIYLLANTKLAFALDYPVEIRQLKTPEDTNRFKSAYLAKSMVPIFNLESLRTFHIGNPNWDQATLAHYLVEHPNKQYGELAKKITLNFDTQMEKAIAVISWLNEKSTYTLRPNHNITEKEDPTAKYLFGDLRGYCVHFAHATVYMLRSLGIPARISTGYMTDFSQAKDGHSLLRMNDRHAWAEVFVTEVGWVPFDTQPNNVEVHGDAPIDQNQLDELMNLIGQPETKLPDQLIADDIIEEKSNFHFSYIYKTIIILIVIMMLIKLWLRKSYLLPFNENKKLYLLNIASNSLAIDLGIRRELGETRIELLNRINKSYPELLASNQSLVELIYSGKFINYNLDLEKYRQSKKQLNWKHQIISLLNPTSVIKYICKKL